MPSLVGSVQTRFRFQSVCNNSCYMIIWRGSLSLLPLNQVVFELRETCLTNDWLERKFCVARSTPLTLVFDHCTISL